MIFYTSSDIAADSAEVISTLERAKAAGYFLLNLCHSKISFALIVCKGDEDFAHEAKSFLFEVLESFKKITRF